MPLSIADINQLISEGKVTKPSDVLRLIRSGQDFSGDGLRTDGTPKGQGFLGELSRPDGKVSTELSIGVDFNGQETLIPTLVPTLGQDEIDYLLQGNKPTQAIINKAVDHAKKRMAEGKSPFAQKDEETQSQDFLSSPDSPEETYSEVDAINEMIRTGHVQRPSDILKVIRMGGVSSGAEQEEPGFFKNALTGLVHGTIGLGESVGTGLEYLGGRLESEPIKTAGETAAKFWEEKAKPFEAPKNLQGAVWEKPELLLNPSWWAYNVSEMAPALAASIIPGVGATRYIKIGGETLKLTPQVIARLARIGGSAAGGVTGGALEGASTYQEVLSRGGTEEEAARAGELMTAASGLLNALSLDKILDPKKLGFLKRFLVSGSTEGITEYLEEPAEVAIKKGIIPDKFSNEDAIEQLIQGLNVVGPAFVTGGGAGSLFGGDTQPPKLKTPDVTTTPTEEPGQQPVTRKFSEAQKTEILKRVRAVLESKQATPVQVEGVAVEFEKQGNTDIAGRIREEINSFVKEAKNAGGIRKDEGLVSKEGEVGKEGEGTGGQVVEQKPQGEPGLPGVGQKEIADPLKLSQSDYQAGQESRIGKYGPAEGAKTFIENVRKRHEEAVKNAVEKNLNVSREAVESYKGQDWADQWLAKQEQPAKEEIPINRYRQEIESIYADAVTGKGIQTAIPGWKNPEIKKAIDKGLAGEELNEDQKLIFQEVLNHAKDRKWERLAKEAQPFLTNPKQALMGYSPEKLNTFLNDVRTEDPNSYDVIIKSFKDNKIDIEAFQKLAAPETKYTGEERRKDLALRGEINKMNIQELRDSIESLRFEAFTHPVTTLKNRRAYELSEKKPFLAVVDVDSLKWVNDNVGHQAGDDLLRHISQVLSDQTPDIYHVGGDEFYLQAGTEEDIDTLINEAYNQLEKNQFAAKTPDGETITYKAGFSYGKGKTVEEADRALQGNKGEREFQGHRAPRGAEPPGVVREASQGNEILPGRQGDRGEEVTPVYTSTPHFTIPESPATIQEQFAALKEGRKPALLLPPTYTKEEAEAMVSEVEGFETLETNQGILIFNPKTATKVLGTPVRKKLKEAIESHQGGLILGYGIESKPRPEEPKAFVKTVDENGNEIQSIVSPTPIPQSVLDSAEALKPEGGQVIVASRDNADKEAQATLEKRVEETAETTKALEQKEKEPRKTKTGFKVGDEITDDSPVEVVTYEDEGPETKNLPDEQTKVVITNIMGDNAVVVKRVPRLIEQPKNDLTQKPLEEIGSGEYEPIHITIDPSMSSLPLPEFISKAKLIARQLFAGKTFKNKADGSEILVPWRGIKHAFSGRVSKNAAALGLKLNELIESAVPDRVGKDKISRNTIKAIHFYKAAAFIDGEPSNVELVVREQLDGKKYYDHYEIREQPNRSMSGEPEINQDSLRPTADRSPNENNLPNIKKEVKEKNKSAFEEGGKIQDFGEKIGGARKDTAERGYTMTKTTKEETGEPAWQKKYVVAESLAHPGQWTILNKGDKFSIRARGSDQLFSSEEEAKKAIPLFSVAQNHRVYEDREKKNEFAIYKKVGDRKLFKVVNQTFPSREEAMKHMAEHAEEILNIKTSFGEEILPVPEIAKRTGIERRTGDATPEMFMETFAPRGIEFGNWNNQEERQQVMNHAYDGLLDLAEVLNVPPKALMLNGDLAIAFGARGKGLSGAAAHYETDYGVINLTKMKGAGKLSHEWFHALDHYFGRLDTKAKSEKEKNARGDMVYPKQSDKYQFLSHGESYKSQLREELKEKYKALMEVMYKKAEQYVEDTKRADTFLSKAREELKKDLDSIRKGLERDLAKDYTWRKSKTGLSPATTEQLTEFDRLANILLEGGDLETSFRYNNPEGEKSATRPKGMNRSAFGRLMAGHQSNDTLEGISSIYKAVRNRTGFTSERTGPLDGLRALMTLYGQRLKMFEDAKEGTEKTKKVPTNYAIEAKKMDQARIGDYWSEPHEMAARAFASYVEDKIAEKGDQSDFLVYHAHGGILLPMIDGFVARPYPEGKERETINKAFDEFISTLQTKETERGIALLRRTDITPQTVTNIADYAQMVDAWLSEVLPKEVLNRVKVELKKLISVQGSNLETTLKNWGITENNIGFISGATTVGKMNALIELSSLVGPKELRKTAYHEAFHVVSKWLLPDKDYRTLLNRFKNEEKIAESFSDYVVNRSKQKPKIQGIFYRLKQIIKKVYNGIIGAGKTPDQIFEDIYGKKYRGFVPGVVEKGAMLSAQEKAVVVEGRPLFRLDKTVRSFGIPSFITRTISSYNKNTKVKEHPDYSAAKSGDREAAARLVVDMVKPETVEAVKKQVGEGAIFVAPNAIEATGKNKIPRALANYYANQTNGSVDEEIVQAVRAFHTGARAMERLIFRATFDGDVVKDGRYVLVDDVTTLGGTLAELANHIQANGGKVEGIIVLTNASRFATMMPTKNIINEIEKRYGNEITKLFGVEPRALTAAEAGYLVGFRDADSLRNRAVKARRERRQRLLSKGIRSPEDQTELNLPTDKEAVDALMRHFLGDEEFNEYNQLKTVIEKHDLPSKKESQGLLSDLKKRLGTGVIKDTDLTTWNHIFSLPHWLGKKFKSIKQAVNIEIKAHESRSKLLHDYYETDLYEVQQKIMKDPVKAQALQNLIWKWEGKGYPPAAVPEPWHEPFEDDKDIQLNLNHYERVRGMLTRHKVNPEVIDAFIHIRKRLDMVLIELDRLMREQTKDQGLISEYRKKVGEINNYFPHAREGDAYIQIFKMSEEEGKEEIVYREHFWKLKEIGKAEKATNRARTWLEEELKAGRLEGTMDEYVITKPRPYKALPDEMFFHVPIESLQQLVSLSVDKLHGIDKDAAEEAISKAVAELLKSRGFGQHMIPRLTGRKGIAGFKKDDIFGTLFDYLSGFSGYKTKIERSKEHVMNLKTVNPRRHPEEYKYLAKYVQDVLANQDKTDRIVDSIRGALFIKFLGYNLKSGVINLLQNPVMAAPVLSQYLKGGILRSERILGKAMFDVKKALISPREAQYTHLSKDEQNAIHELHEEGATTDLFLRELKGQLPTLGWSKFLRKVIDTSGIFMSLAEKFNRTSTGLAAYRIARKELGMDHVSAVEWAKERIYDAHFLYGTANLPELMRGGTVEKYLRSGYTFRTFTHNYLSCMAHLLLNQGIEGKKAFSRGLRNLFVFGGLTAIPFFNAFSTLLMKLVGDDDDDPLTKAREVMPEKWMKDMVVYGLPGVFGWDVSGSLNIELPTSWTDILGAPTAFYQDTVNMINSWESGQRMKAAAESPITPQVIRNAMRGIELSTKGMTTRSGRNINMYGEVGAKKITELQAAAKILGFQPTGVSNISRSYRAVKKIEEGLTEKKQELADRYVNAYRDKDMDEVREIRNEIREWNENMVKKGKPWAKISIQGMVKSRRKVGLDFIPKQLRGKAVETSQAWQ